jgi:hypothetical protein
MNLLRTILAATALVAASANAGSAADNCGAEMQRFTAQWNTTTPAHKTAEAQRYLAAAQAAQKAGQERDCVALLRKAGDAMK